MKIAILVPVCSRKQTYSSFDDIPFVNKLYPSFLETKEDGYEYTFFIGFDDDDEFYKANVDNLKKYTENVHMLSGCQHAPAWAWNKLADIAYKHSSFEYFFQIGDDVKLVTPGWTTRFVSKLKEHDNFGVVGPCNLTNYYQRVNYGKPPVIENCFVSRKHLDMFGYFFYPTIKNWYCDVWVTEIYVPFFSEIQKDIVCENSIVDIRYAIDSRVNIHAYVKEGIDHIKSTYGKHVFSYCIYGSSSKYCRGMIKNLEQIEKLFPLFETWIHLGNDVPAEYIEEYKKFKNVKLIQHNETGGRLMSYRFFSIDDSSVAVMIIRDGDSRFHDRDIWCTRAFMTSSFNAFTIRDHPYHGRKIMGGQWGMRRIPGIDVQKSYEDFKSKYDNLDKYRSDQDFIDICVYDNQETRLAAFSSGIRFNKETTIPIGVPRKTPHDFCGNVVLFDNEGNEYYEFKL
jgi:hypothetical protein